MESIKMFRAGLCLYCTGDWAGPVELGARRAFAPLDFRRLANPIPTIGGRFSPPHYNLSAPFNF